MNLNFLEQLRINGCEDEKQLPFDFYVYNNESEILIEFDGEQHFNKSRLYDKDNESFELRVKHDKMKDAYCKKHDIPLLRINYREFDMIEEILEKELAHLLS